MLTHNSLNLSHLFEPRGVAIAAGSKLTAAIGEKISRGGYAGAIKTLGSDDSGLDLALLDGSSGHLNRDVEACAAAGIGHAVIFSSGVGVSDAVRAAGAGKIVVVGAQSMGIINPAAGLLATTASRFENAEGLAASHVTVICQKGSIGATLAAQARDAGFALRTVIGAGDEAMVSVADYLQALASDEATRVAAICIDGVGNGRAFCTALAAVRAAGKRVVVLKGGVTDEQERLVWRGILGRYGAILAETYIEFLDIALFLGTRDRTPLPEGKGVAIISGGGGNGVNAADLCAKYGLPVPVLSQETLGKLKPLVPAIASLGNPFDLTPEMGSVKYSGNYAEVLDLIVGDPVIDTIFFSINAMSRARIAQVGVLADFRRRDTGDLLMAFNMLAPEPTAELAAAKAYNFVEPERGVKAFARMIAAGRLEALGQPGIIGEPAKTVAPEDVARLASLPLLPQERAATLPEAMGQAAAAGYPVTLHHGDAARPIAVGDIRNGGELSVAWEKVGAPGLVQAEDRRRLAFRFTGFTHPVFGPMVTCEAGGPFFGMVNEVAVAPAGLDRAAAERLVSELGVVKSAAKIDRTANLDLAVDAFHRFAAAIAASRPQNTIAFDPVLIGRDDATVAVAYSV